MPRVRRRSLPEPLFRHLARRVRERRVSAEQLLLLREWLLSEPEVPVGRWYKEFEGFTICGEGEWVKTFLVPGQVPFGEAL